MDDPEILKTQPFDASRANRSAPGPHIVTLQGTHVGTIHALSAATTTIGRLPNNDFPLASSVVSKRHAIITKDATGFEIADANSRNGVLLNGQRIDPGKPVRMHHGDNIRLSDHLLLFQDPSAFADATGLCQIRLDEDKIAAEAEALLADWRACVNDTESD